MNKTQFTGRLTADVELKQTPNGVSVCSFTLAVKRPRVKDTTDFINFVAWRQQADFFAKFFKKGDAMEVSGVLTSRKFQDQKGNNRIAYEVVCDEVDFPLTNSKGEAKEEQTNEPHFEDINDDDLPF